LEGIAGERAGGLCVDEADGICGEGSSGTFGTGSDLNQYSTQPLNATPGERSRTEARVREDF
jgi:hypothetical protein